MKNTMLKYLVFLLCIFFYIDVEAQDQTTGRSRSIQAVQETSVLLVPYETKMYIADVTRELCEANEMGVDEIKRILREGLCQLVATELGENARVIDLLNEGSEEHEKDIYEIYGATNYEYIQVPVPDSVKIKKNDPNQVGRGTTVENGQIRSYYDGKERFMDTKIEDKRILSYLQKRYNSDYLVFLNELDIRVKRNGPPIPGEERPRQIKVHYTIFDAKGKKLSGSAVMLDYPYGKNNIFDIVRVYFKEIGVSISNELFPPTPTETNSASFTLPGRGK